MIPSNFIPAGPIKKQKHVHYTDGSPSREVEDELMQGFTQGFAYKRPLIKNIRDRLMKILELLKNIEEELAKL